MSILKALILELIIHLENQQQSLFISLLLASREKVKILFNLSVFINISKFFLF